MPIVDVIPEGPLSLAEFERRVDPLLDPNDPQSLLRAAPLLAGLAQNRTFLAEEIHRQLQDWRTFQAANEYVSETFVISRTPKYLIRANFWTRPPEVEQERKVYDQLNEAYWLVHNHSYSFLTVGYWGPGYRTEMYEIDPKECEADVGDKVQMRPLGTFGLPVGKVLFYRAQTDLHLQLYPDDFSISINLILFSADCHFTQALYFDKNTGEVIGRTESRDDGRMLITDLAAIVGGEEIEARLRELAERHPSPRVRACAKRGLLLGSGNGK